MTQAYHNSKKSVFLWILQREDFVDSKREIINLRLLLSTEALAKVGSTPSSVAKAMEDTYSQVSQ